MIGTRMQNNKNLIINITKYRTYRQCLLDLAVVVLKGMSHQLANVGSLNPKYQRQPVREPSKTSGAIGFRPSFLFLFWWSKKEKKGKTVFRHYCCFLSTTQRKIFTDIIGKAG